MGCANAALVAYISPIYGSLIRIKVLTGGRWRTLAGVVNMGTAKIVEVKGMALEADFHPVMLLINDIRDKPGFIGALGTLLGESNIQYCNPAPPAARPPSRTSLRLWALIRSCPS